MQKRGIHTVRVAALFALASMLLIAGLYVPGTASAAKFSNRKLTLGTTEPGAATTYSFAWHYNTSTTLGSIRFEACTDAFASDVCVAPAGIDFSSAALIGQTGATGFSILSQVPNEIILTRSPALRGAVNASYVFNPVTNPSAPESFFVRIRTYASDDGTGAMIEENSVANATATPILINTTVPPLLYFCVGITVSNECKVSVGNFINYGDLLTPNDNYATSQFSVATNAANGYVVTINGNTMAAGNKVIDALTIPTARQTGEAQFGLNLRANTEPPVGADITGLGIGTVSTNYNIPDLFQYQDGDIVASAVTGSNFDIFTVTYIVNVPPDQPAGVYNTTVTYICTASF